LRLPTAGPPLSAPAPDAPINPLHEDYFAEKTSLTPSIEALRSRTHQTRKLAHHDLVKFTNGTSVKVTSSARLVRQMGAEN
ncbi:hypothetical protein, partial [Streptomyces thermoalcalitolerans]|uniref:hypothetical protein n=1 Tax=Streptomyces thermoalcalitolerans TaxID=65605 RepID=UPI0031D7ABF6